MPFVKVDAVIFGKSATLKKLNKITSEMESSKEVFQELLKGGLAIQRTAVKSIQQTSPGSSTEIRYSPKRTVRVSPPGEPPNSDTGRLANSIRVSFNQAERWVEVGTDLLYGAWLEFGTLNMAARPWLSPAYAQNRDKILSMVKKVFRDTVKKEAK